MRSDKYSKNDSVSEGADCLNLEENQKKPKKKKKAKKGKRKIFKRIILTLLILMLVCIGGAFAYAFKVVHSAPKIDPSKIYDILSESTTIYDDQGELVDSVYTEANRDNVSYKDIPKDLKYAFIALEDKTFEKHKGFNFTRILGAIKDAVVSRGRVSGTSTITQQLARNLYLKETQFDRSMKRKIIEAYYTRVLEKNLSKDQILEAYLNTIFLGFNSNGVQAASQAYFSKDVKDLTLAQCAALAALPQAPSSYQLVKYIEGGNPDEYKDDLLKVSDNGIFVANDISKNRRITCLKLMKEQGYIDQKQFDEASKVSLKDMLNPNYTAGRKKTSYFADYVVEQVIDDLMKEKKMDHDTAWDTVYKGGLKIYSTMSKGAQEAVEAAFENDNNFPYPEPIINGSGNIINRDGRTLLYAYSNMFNSEGDFILSSDEYKKNEDGSLTIYKDNDLNIYDTKANGKTEYSLEFKPIFKYVDGELYTINGGYINIPGEFKSKDEDGNLIVSAKFLEKEKDFFKAGENGSLIIPPTSYTLRPKVVQPQGAMTIIENSTGYIKAMQGGRGASGRMILNRAILPHQPGSSIKPLGVYSAALQQSAEEAKEGKKHKFKDLGIDKQGAKNYGDYFTASSIIVDEPTHIEGRQWPRNAGGGNSGPMTMRTAMQNSVNTAAVKIWLQVGGDFSSQLVKKYGITTLAEEGAVNDLNPAALALGGMARGVSTLEMASAYTTFANGGVRCIPSSYTKVVDKNGNVLLENEKPKEVRVLDPGVAYIMNSMLRSVVQGGTGYQASISGVQVGGKTGTTDHSYDIWFDGITPKYSASLWIGNDNNFDLSTSSSAAAKLWSKIMSNVPGISDGSYPSMPSDVVEVGGEYYVRGTEKGLIGASAFTVKVNICPETGLLATPDCPNPEEKEFNLLNGEKPPKYYSYLHNKDTNTYPIDPNDQEKYDEALKKEEEAKKEQEKKEEEKDKDKGSKGHNIFKPIFEHKPNGNDSKKPAA